MDRDRTGRSGVIPVSGTPTTEDTRGGRSSERRREGKENHSSLKGVGAVMMYRVVSFFTNFLKSIKLKRVSYSVTLTKEISFISLLTYDIYVLYLPFGFLQKKNKKLK